ncbi:LORF2 protein, partial [Crocuta crocuta]
LKINLSKVAQDSNKVGYKEILKDLNKLKNFLCSSWIGKVTIFVSSGILPKLTYRSSANLFQLPLFFFFFCGNGQADLRIHTEIQNSYRNLQKGPQIVKSNLIKEIQSGRTRTACLQAESKAIVIETVWYRCKDTYTGQWNKIKSLTTDHYIYSEMIFTRVPRSFKAKEGLLHKLCRGNW